MFNPEIDVELTLLSSDEGGRRGPIFGEYRGVFSASSNEGYSMRFLLPDGCSFSPGETLTLAVQFYFPEQALPAFSLGTEFAMLEGRVVGYGRVAKVYRPQAS